MSDAIHAPKASRQVARRPLAPGALAYSIPNSATMLGVSSATVWRMIARKEIEARKIGARTVIRTEALKAYIESTALATKDAQ